MTMQRNIASLFTGLALKHLKYIPKFPLHFRGALDFLLDYILLRGGEKKYQTRKGTTILSRNTDDLGTIVEIFIKREYWEIIWDWLTIIDIGANTGVFSTYCLEWTTNSKIYAYEPFESSYKQILENARLNEAKSSKIIPNNCAVSDKNGEIRFFITPQSLTNSTFPNADIPDQPFISVPTITLEDCFRKNQIQLLDILKMDCEWSEYDILYSAPVTLLARIREIRMEFHNIDTDKQNGVFLKSFLESRGFETIVFKNHIDDRCTAGFLISHNHSLMRREWENKE